MVLFVFRIVIICLHTQKAGRTAPATPSPQSEAIFPFVVLNFKTAADLSARGGGGQSINTLYCQEIFLKAEFWRSHILSGHSRLQSPDCLSNWQGL